MKNAIEWIAFQSIAGYANIKPISVYERFGDIREFFSAGDSARREMGLFSDSELSGFENPNIAAAEKILNYCNAKGYNVITLEDEQYPQRLRGISNPPAVLYVDGELPDIDKSVGVAMVGTRSCTSNGMVVAAVLSYRLAKAGAVIISGGAIGIDTNCSRGAVAAGQRSIIVLGCGISYPYLLKNREIRDAVAQNGAVVTEFQPNYSPTRFSFPIRNRLMSALANAVVIVEAPAGSGALITAGCALDQGRDVYAIPGDIAAINYAGNNSLLRDGATPVYTPMDVLYEYTAQYPGMLNTQGAETPIADDPLFGKMLAKYGTQRMEDEPVRRRSSRREKPQSPPPEKRPLKFEADENIKKVYSCFTNETVAIDKLIHDSGIDTGDVLAALTELEIEGAIIALPGGRYSVNGNY